jgi:MFS family permease
LDIVIRPEPAARIPVWREPGMPALLLLTAAGFSGYAALLPVAPLWAVHGGANEAGSGFVNGLLLLATIATQPFVPRLLRRFGTAPVLAAGLLFLGVPSLLHLISDQLGWIFAMSVLRGFGFGILTVTGSTTLAHLVSPARHGAAIGAYGASIAIPQVILLPAGPWLVDVVGYWIVFALGATSILGIAATPWLARALRDLDVERLVREDAAGDSADGAVPSEASGNRPPRRVASRLARPTIILLGATLAGGALITFAPQMTSAPLVTVGGLALFTVAAAVSRWRIGSLADRYGTRVFLWPLVICTVLGLVLTAFAVDNPGDTKVMLFLIALTLVGIGYGGIQNLTLLLSLGIVSRKDYGTASAVWNIGFDAGSGVGSVLVGTVAAGLSFPPALLLAAAISLATLPLALMRGRRTLSGESSSGR